ncbi:adipocyte plasma membrane-associated protein [Plakobranchus ocellatus]|uniref:Adipocyte plasma membrane-associated protein n=1 Tax=Plakobranchus ocellatus TaxID=259542 RepID=A0AAV4BBQ6_9GAST|nr:adipocyte plasma membrane-associated protein [Plakobranchus ocellatus]
MLLVLDAYRGVFEVHPVTGVTRHLYNSLTVVNGRPSYYLSDLMEMPDGTIVISDASATFDYANRFWIRFEARADGRLLGFNPVNGQVEEIMAGLAYPSGLELTTDKQAFLLAEASRSRIYRVELSKARFFQKSYFHENLPGMPEHIRQAGNDSYWVALTFPRYHGDVSVQDQYSSRPAARNFLAQRRSEEQLKMMYNKRGLAVQLSAEGQVIRSMHDPTSSKVTEVTEVNEDEGLAYVGTRRQNAVIRVMTSAKRLTLDSMIQVMRSRCKVTEDKILEAKEALRRQILQRKSASNDIQSSSPMEINQSHQENNLKNNEPLTQTYPQNTASAIQTKPRAPKSIRQGLSRIQKLLSRGTTQNTRSNFRSASGFQQTNPPQPPKQGYASQAVVAGQESSWASKQSQPPPQNRQFSPTSFQDQNIPHLPQPPQQISFSQPNKDLFSKPSPVTQQKYKGLTLPGLNRDFIQSPSVAGAPSNRALPATSDKIYRDRTRQPYLQNVPMPPYVPMAPGQYGSSMSGAGQVYAPNGNVPRPFSATGYQNNFAPVNPPQTNRGVSNPRQPSSSYQNNNFGPKPNYRIPSNNSPTDPNSPFLPHGLVPTGHHTGDPSARQETGNDPQIVHKVVNGQLITQIIVPDNVVIKSENTQYTTTISPFAFDFMENPIPYKKEIVKPVAPPQDDKQKKTALGGFLGIAEKSRTEPIKPPVFDLGPDMANTLPEYGQIPASALDAAPMAIYGLDISTRSPTKAESNAATALSMFTGVSDSRNPTDQQQQTPQDVLKSLTSQDHQQQQLVTPTQFTGQILNTAVTLDLPPQTQGVGDQIHPKKETLNIQTMEMFHPGEHRTHSNSATNAESKNAHEDRKESILKRGLQQLNQLFRTENPSTSQPVAPTSPVVMKQPHHSIAESSNTLGGEHGPTHQSSVPPQQLQATNGQDRGSLSTHSKTVQSSGVDFLSGIVGTQASPQITVSSSHDEMSPVTTFVGSPTVGTHVQHDIPGVPTNNVGHTTSNALQNMASFGTSTADTSTSSTRQDLPTASTLDSNVIASYSGAATIHQNQHKVENSLKNEAVREPSLFSSLTETSSPSHSKLAANIQLQLTRPQSISQTREQEQLVPQNEQQIRSIPQAEHLNRQPIQQSNPQQTQSYPQPQTTFQTIAQAAPRAQQTYPSLHSGTGGSQATRPRGSHGFIQIYKGPGEYVIIPLSESMLQKLSGVQFGNAQAAFDTNQQSLGPTLPQSSSAAFTDQNLLQENNTPTQRLPLNQWIPQSEQTQDVTQQQTSPTSQSLSSSASVHRSTQQQNEQNIPQSSWHSHVVSNSPSGSGGQLTSSSNNGPAPESTNQHLAIETSSRLESNSMLHVLTGQNIQNQP